MNGTLILGGASVELQQKLQELSKFQVAVMLNEHTSPSEMIIFVTQDENGKTKDILFKKADKELINIIKVEVLARTDLFETKRRQFLI